MNKNINLDINTYSINDLEKLLKLNTNYNEDIIISKKKQLERTIFNSSIQYEKKEELNMFLDNVQNKLLGNLSSKLSKKNILEQYDSNHFIIKNPNLESKKKIIEKIYTIDSLFRENSSDNKNYTNNFIFELPENVNKIISMNVSLIEIPITHYNISEELNNNKILIDNSLITLDDGLYKSSFITNNLDNNYSLEDEINEKLLLTDISYSINKKNGKSIFTNNSSHDISINFAIDNSNVLCNNIDNKLLGNFLGFNKSSILVEANSNISSDMISAITYPRYLYLVIDDFQTNTKNQYRGASSDITTKNIIGKINILGLLEHNTNEYKRKYFGPTNIKKLHIQLLDDHGRLFQLNNIDWSFVVTFECLEN